MVELHYQAVCSRFWGATQPDVATLAKISHMPSRPVAASNSTFHRCRPTGVGERASEKEIREACHGARPHRRRTGHGAKCRLVLARDDGIEDLGGARPREQVAECRQVTLDQHLRQLAVLGICARDRDREALGTVRSHPSGLGRVEYVLHARVQCGGDRVLRHARRVDDVDVDDRRRAEGEERMAVKARLIGGESGSLEMRDGQHDSVDRDRLAFRSDRHHSSRTRPLVLYVEAIHLGAKGDASATSFELTPRRGTVEFEQRHFRPSDVGGVILFEETGLEDLDRDRRRDLV